MDLQYCKYRFLHLREKIWYSRPYYIGKIMGQRRCNKSSEIQHHRCRDLIPYLSFVIRKYQTTFVEIGKGQPRIRLYYLRYRTCIHVPRSIVFMLFNFIILLTYMKSYIWRRDPAIWVPKMIKLCLRMPF